MFFHFCGSFIVWRFAMDFMFFGQFASQFHWFYGFSAGWQSNMDILFPEKYSCFGGSFHKVTVGPWFWHVKAATAIYSAQDVREVNNVVESLDAKDVNTPTPCKMLEK